MNALPLSLRAARALAIAGPQKAAGAALIIQAECRSLEQIEALRGLVDEMRRGIPARESYWYHFARIELVEAGADL